MAAPLHLNAKPFKGMAVQLADETLSAAKPYQCYMYHSLLLHLLVVVKGPNERVGVDRGGSEGTSLALALCVLFIGLGQERALSLLSL